ncbi:MAG: HAD family hydrolase [Candidatus Methylacidiphilales bacterium]
MVSPDDVIQHPVKWNEIKAVLFDLDGTLLNTLDDIVEAANRVLIRHGYPSHDHEQYKRMVGDGPAVLFQRAIRTTDASDPVLATLVEAYQKECALQADRHARLFPGMEVLLNGLSARRLRLAVLTNKLQPHADNVMAHFFNRWRWECVLGSGGHVARKPDPEGALRIAELLCITPGECLFLGDTDVDMMTAKRAGMLPVGVLWGFRSEEELRHHGAELILERPEDLLEHLPAVRY